MLNNFRNLQSLFWSHGSRWLFFRVGYALRKRTGFLRARMPAYRWEDRPLGSWVKRNIPFEPEAYAKWRKRNSPRFLFDPPRAERSGEEDSRHAVEGRIPANLPWNPQIAIDEANRIVDGELKYFAHKFVHTGFPPDWHKDPTSGKKVNASRHWSELSDEADLDIKFVWEASRFSMVYPLLRAYRSTGNEKYAEAFWTLIESWAEFNPPNTGPNWMDGQEAALRLLAWMFGYFQFLNSPSSTPQRIAKFSGMVAAHAERIDKNIEYAISTRSNHTISEAFGLWLTGLLFPELKGAEKYYKRGRELLEQEAAAQIFPDGTYSMHSLNYHRFVLHIYLCMIRLGELNKSPVSILITKRVSASINFLSQLIDPETGEMPAYGSNDGALVLPLNDCDFADYRPLLQLGLYIAKGELLFEPGPWDEDIFWFYGMEPFFHAERRVSKVELPERNEAKVTNFPNGGIHLLHGPNSKAVIRCTEFRSRPSHADQLHVDLWIRGRNVACDAGTYLYSGNGVWRNGLAHTAVHNTVIVDHQDQMKLLTRFTWTDWANGKVLQHGEDRWRGAQDGYKRLSDPVTHKRTVFSLGDDRWLVVDHLAGRQNHHYALHWLLNDFPYEEINFGVRELGRADGASTEAKTFVQMGLLNGQSAFSIVREDPNSTRGWRSQYYADKEPAISAMLETNGARTCFWTFFGFEDDTIALLGNQLKITANRREISVDLVELNK